MHYGRVKHNAVIGSPPELRAPSSSCVLRSSLELGGASAGLDLRPRGLRCRANPEQLRQSRPDSGLGLSHFQVKVVKNLRPRGSSAESSRGRRHRERAVVLERCF